MNAERSPTKSCAKSQRRKGNEASSTRILRVKSRRRADYNESSSEDKIVRPVAAKKKRPVFLKGRKKPRAESEPNPKKV